MLKMSIFHCFASYDANLQNPGPNDNPTFEPKLKIQECEKLEHSLGLNQGPSAYMVDAITTRRSCFPVIMAIQGSSLLAGQPFEHFQWLDRSP